SWYATPTGGTVLASTEVLVDGTTYYGSLIDGSGCDSAIRLEVLVILSNNGIAQITGGTNEVCSSDEVTYTTESGMTNYVWTITGGVVVSGGQSTDNTITISWTNEGSASVNVSYQNSCLGLNNATLNLSVNICSDLTITKTVDNLTPFVGDNVVFTITVNNVGSSQVTDLVVSEVIPSGYTYVGSQVSAGTYNYLTGLWNIPLIDANQSVSLVITATVLGSGDYTNIAFIETSTPIDIDLNNNSAQVTTEPLCLLVYNEFSPNNDGSNDFFTIDCIENYPANKLEVFNRYGVLVYSKDRYTNDWDGTANVSGTVNKDDRLPAGTYYYLLDIGEKEGKRNGWLSIVR
ncbi:gliding motility-associated C-terminal domain-containing protein, partial [uncultured Flavobacterium sp.]|uniref:T9SS type B sorting domain-containing protein n=1 Tax=uncultured Flavobacterium sp. TaxID=165435 RepID=UPI0030C8CDB2